MLKTKITGTFSFKISVFLKENVSIAYAIGNERKVKYIYNKEKRNQSC